MLTGKIDKLFLSLEKISRDTGEDEYDLIFLLAKKDGIYITDKITPSLCNNQTTVWVLKPYSDEEYKRFKLFFISRFPYHLFDKILYIFEKDGVSYIRYPEFVENWQINDDIFEVLNEEHGINSDEFNEIEWLEIFDSKEWRSCVIQTARELVAYNVKCKRT